MSVPSLLGYLVLCVGVPLNVFVTWRLWSLYRSEPHNLVLRDRVVISAFVLVVVIVFSLLFLNNDAVPPPLNFESTKLVSRFVTLLLAVVPASYWLWIYR